jgi:hypothetical protein
MKFSDYQKKKNVTLNFLEDFDFTFITQINVGATEAFDTT